MHQRTGCNQHGISPNNHINRKPIFLHLFIACHVVANYASRNNSAVFDVNLIKPLSAKRVVDFQTIHDTLPEHNCPRQKMKLYAIVSTIIPPTADSSRRSKQL